MKAQHRHELHTNQLADWLEKTSEKLKPYARAILGILVALAIVLAVYAYLGSVERRATVAASDQLVMALDSQMMPELQRTVDDHRGTQPATVAQLVMAETMLDNGANALFANKPAGREAIFNASEAFATVEKETKDPMLRAWALYGLGRAHESIGDLDRARDDFQRLIKEYPDSSLVESARTHINRLNQPSIKEFYDWFAKQEPRPPAQDNSPGIPGVKPAFNLEEPSESVSPGDVKLPSALSGSTSSRTSDNKSGGTSIPPVAPVPESSPPGSNSPPAGASK
ncbi:MAG TPA: tetratricopeptide repeat protein [Pirellulales bacterium]|jgi:tetratricopeptide (TPR) repeat protein|nr:tetratricopeptide repeat protein [Pirellulales bacterium]